MCPRPTQVDPQQSAKQAGLVYVSDTSPGFRRRKVGRGFVYIDHREKKVSNIKILKRIEALVLPPAWKDVWICPIENGHLQATGIDERGRKQYKYHPRWQEVRDETKYNRMLAFGRVIPLIRERTTVDLAKPPLSREKVLAAVVQLLEKTMIRVGNEQYAKENKSHGLTTLKNKHVEVEGSTLKFNFKGKSGKYHEIELSDRRLARVIKRLQDLPGQEVFQYLDSDGNTQSINSSDVNAYIKEITGEDFTAKDFRTWAGSVLACLALREIEPFETKTQAKKNITAAIKSVAEQLGNTPAVCRKCYVHPHILERYLDGTMLETLTQLTEQELKKSGPLRPEEAALLRFLESSHRTESSKH